jgi:Sec7-like guanine-nucleotide exchange factor
MLFCENFDFRGQNVDTALRYVFKKLRLPKEFQEIERIMKGFSN